MTEVLSDVAGRKAADAATEEEFRSQLRGWLTDNHPGRRPRDATERLAWQKNWLANLFDAGFAGPSWPREYGGMDLPFARQVIYQEEYGRMRLPGPLGTGVGIAGPTLIKYGTEQQKRLLLPTMLRGDKIWAQAYSEPEAGSDLAALRTTAQRDGEHYLVNGQKCWNSAASIADTLFTLVRTGSQQSRAKGISYLIIDAHSPGVTIRPLRDLTGGADFSEIFFDNARVPVESRIGDENDGWKLVRTSLGHERAAGTMNQAGYYRQILNELIDLAKTRGATSDPLVRTQLADFEIRVRIMRYQGMRTIESILANGEPGAAGSTSRMFTTAFEQDLHEFAVDMLGSYGTLGRNDAHAVERSRWVWGFLRTRASTIGTGTSEIQRNTIAEQVLKLPFDPAMPPR